MQQFMRRNSRTATLANLVINAVVPFLILLPATTVSVKGGAPNLFSVLLPSVFISALATTLVTFATLPGRAAGAGWLPAALRSGLGIGLLLAGPVLLALGLLRLLAPGNPLLAKELAIGLSAVVGAAAAYLASRLAVRRAMRWHTSQPVSLNTLS